MSPKKAEESIMAQEQPIKRRGRPPKNPDDAPPVELPPKVPANLSGGGAVFVPPAPKAIMTPSGNSKAIEPKVGPSKKAQTLKADVAKNTASSLKLADLAMRAISKLTKNQQKPLGFNAKPFPAVSSGCFSLADKCLPARLM